MMMFHKLENRLMKKLERQTGCDIISRGRKSEHLFDLTITGCSKDGIQFSAWLPLAAIRELTPWTASQVACLSDYPDMVEQGDWSGIRDSSEDAIWKIFRIHVPILDTM